MGASRARSSIRPSSCSDNACLGWRVATPTATTPPGWPTTRSTSCCSTAIRSPAPPWRRSRRSRGSRTRRDGGFASPKLFTFLEQQQVEYVVAMASNARLEKRARRLMGKARKRSKTTGQTAHLYGETRYAARKWNRKRRVIIKAEVVRHPGRDPKNNPRFVVTNLTDDPEAVYQFYCGRGDVENRLKELHHGLEMDRTSCPHFLAN